MTGRKYYASLLVIILTAAMMTGLPLAQTNVRARFIHVASGNPAIDIYVNGELAVADLSYGENSAYFSLPAGAAEVKATVEGTTTQLFHQPLSLDTEASAIVLSSNAGTQLHIIADDLRPLEFGMSRLLIVNALEDDSAIDIIASEDDRKSGEYIAPGSTLGPFELAADQVEFSLLPSNGDDDTARHNFNTTAPAGTSNVLVIHGRISDPQILHTAAATDAEGQNGRVRFVHAVQGAAPVDLKIDDYMIIPSLAFASPSEHIAIPSGSHQLTLSLGGTVFTSMTLDVSAGPMQTVAVMGSPATLNLFTYNDSQQDLNESSAVVNLINAVPNSSVSRLRLDSGAIIAADLGFGEQGGPAQIVPGKQSMALILEIGEDRGTIEVPPVHYYAGSYYNLIALSGSAFTAPRLLIAETSLMRGLSASLPAMEIPAEDESAMTADEPSVVSEGTDATSQSEAAPEPDTALETDAQVEAEQAAEAETATESDTVSESDAPDEPGPALVAISPFAVVNLDPSARLQLRQYPSSDALSLGLLHGGTDLTVLGRRGLTEYYAGETPDLPLDLSDYDADPAAALYPVQDLQPADTWIFVMFQTPDGGALLGWVNALYLQVFDETGEKQRVASLPTVRQNRAGSSFNTNMRPTNLADFVTARVYRLNPGALLNMRMANDPDSEVLTQLAPNTKLSLIGLDQADEWAYVDYVTETDEIIRGWVSAEYAQLLLNGEPVRVNTLRALDETVAPRISDRLRGSMRSAADAGPTPIPPPDDMMDGIVGEVALDPGAMLHLRRQPDANAESLALIPARAKVSISGITENAEWLKTSYEEQDGWIASHYVALLLRGRLYHRIYIESLLPVHDNAGNSTG